MSRYVYDTNPMSRTPDHPVRPEDHYHAGRAMQSDTVMIPLLALMIAIIIGFLHLFTEGGIIPEVLTSMGREASTNTILTK
jgi:hypothetical protein